MTEASGYDDDETFLEEHVILRLPDEPLARSLRDRIVARDGLADVRIQMQDGRRGTFFVDGGAGGDAAAASAARGWPVQLVDLPCVIEAQRTQDQKQFYKVADISQMLLVGREAAQAPPDGLWPHGLTAPLSHVRERRFRKRLSRRAIENVEREVERLLLADIDCEDVVYELHEHDDEDDDEPEADADAEAGAVGAGDDADDADHDDAEADDGAGDGEGEGDAEGDGDEEGDGAADDAASAEAAERRHQIALLMEEIADWEVRIAEKQRQADTIPNPVIKRRFTDIVTRLRDELSQKQAQLSALTSE
ncbi:hypothetical protein CXG81DRAFT_14256 [Caulochytrium protostelioides]|uniref:TAFII55 protein conserved region domain-containing protein n=1 Tax=Caulochytrium protostelioides TaxID=1555241 RepID=A0A4P9X3K7_9FUNG|nr:hypothetical protein CXG81DRAFT_14256 [Caulochytrium protostelioides]|eukprot:RKO99619.1 hypothetical protein CXG81DRAFT_14256 [Caulochytrium protostelioides]